MSVIGGTGRSGTTDPMRGYANQDGPGNTTVDYGPHRGGFRPPSQPSSYVDHATPFYDAAQAGAVQNQSEFRDGMWRTKLGTGTYR